MQDSNSEATQIPIIDFEPFIQGNAEAKRAVADQIYQACHEFGFMYLKNHGISEAELAQLFTQIQLFFDLPAAVKDQVRRSPHTNCGYVGIQAERLNPNRPGDLKEAFNVGESTVWLTEQDEFRQVVFQFYRNRAAKLAFYILRAFALGLNLPELFFETKHGQNLYLRLLHYPPLNCPPAASQLRAGEHTDYGSITLLFQDQTGGLEICTQQGEWIPAPFIPETVVVNIGDAMQHWTNDQLRSTRHRVVNPSGEQVGRSRYSVAFFCDPNLDVELACLSDQTKAPPRYPPVRYQDYLNQKFAATY
jgi:isopenicillin N synthase-like dioxygenase